MKQLDLSRFICEQVTHREQSMFCSDLRENEKKLKDAILGKSILVIGGAGTIGASYIKAVLPFGPKALVVVDTNENELTELVRDLRGTKGIQIPKELITYPMSYASPVFEKMYRNREGFDIVANFSAHKHVRSEKDVYAVEAMIRNNVIEARGLLELLSEFPPKTYFCVSTDKAANPVNIMGASKRIMEDLIFAYSERFPVKTARFANVAFSNGSLPAGFLERIAKRQPLAAPTDVKRYFVSPEESGQICLLASVLAPNRGILFPKIDVGQMMTFDRIAEKLLLEYGYEPEYCGSEEEALEKAESLNEGSKWYPVVFSRSDTSGEKAYEEFYTDDEVVDITSLKALGIIYDKPIPLKERVEQLIADLENQFSRNDVQKADIVGLIGDYLPGFAHIETGKSLDGKM